MLVKSLLRHLALIVLTAVVVAFCTVFAARHVLFVDMLAERAMIRAERAVLQAEIEDVRAERESLRQERDRLIGALEDIAVPPNNDKLFRILSQGVGVTETAVATDSVDAVAEAAFDTDLTTAQKTDAFTQEIFIQNTHASNNLCYSAEAWSGADTCQTICAASGTTCSGAATDGIRLSSGQNVSRQYDGTSCICVVGSGAGTTYQTERVVR